MHLDASDAATGLPPMQEDLDGALLAITGAKGGEGIVALPGTSEETLAVKYLHLRGLVRHHPDDPDSVDWAQVTVAIPHGLLPAVLAALST